MKGMAILHDLIVYGGELIIFYYFFHVFMPVKIRGKKKYFMSIGVLFSIICLSTLLDIRNPSIIYYIYIFSSCYMVFSSKWFYKLFVIIIALCIGVIIETIVLSFLALLFKKEISIVYYNAFLSEIVVECIKLTLITCVGILFKSSKTKNSVDHLKNKKGLLQVCFFMILPSVSLIILMTNLNTILEIKGGMLTSGVIIAVSICLLIFNITSIILLEKNIENQYYKQINETIGKQLTYQLKHYEELEQMNKETKKLKHDMKNHMLCIRSLIKEGHIEEAQAYMGKVVGSLEKLDHHITTGNHIADAILQEKYKQAQTRKIQFTVVGGFMPEDHIDPIDRCTVLANAVDNAIEACEKTEDIAKRYIYIDLYYNKGYTFITVKNPVHEKVNVAKNMIKTSKRDKTCHGYGLENIRKSVEKYNGMLDLRCEESEFILQATFHTQIHTS